MAEQENIEQNTVFHFSLDTCDIEIAEWILQQPNKDAYLKSLILADKERSRDAEIVLLPTKHDQNWDAHFDLLQDFQKQFGRLPAYGESYKGFRLGRWLHDTARRARETRPDRIKKLQSIGAIDKWERNLALVERFKNVYGRLPTKNEVFDRVNIGAWLATQTAKLRNDRRLFSDEQIKRLLELGIYISDWDKKCCLLESFKAEYHRLPKYAEIYHDVNIGRWLAYQRKALDPNKHADRAERFRQLGVLPRTRTNNQKIKNKA